MMRWTVACLLCVLLILASAPVLAGQTDPQAVWPLCGRITANPPAGWNESQGCPAARFGNAAYDDQPFSATFGPRPLYSEGDRYDFHRGMDIATPIGTPIFAMTDGLVQIAGVDGGYTDPVIKLRHFRPGQTSCTGVGCYYSLYLHVSNWVVAPGTSVVKGQLIGHTGASSVSGFAHLHFEVRDAPTFDPTSAWSRDAVHPLKVLPYSVANNTLVSFGAVDATNANATTATIIVDSNRYDFEALQLKVFDQNHVEVAQPGNTPNAKGYYVLPPFFDMEAANFQYSHKDSSTYPWSGYGSGGANECPYYPAHGAAYDENVHMDAQYPADFHDGQFNGIHITPKKYWPSDVGRYWVQLQFLALKGPAVCIEASALFARGTTQTASWGNCTVAPPPTIVLNVSTNARRSQVSLSWTGASGTKVDVRRNGVLLVNTKNTGAYQDRAVAKGNHYDYRICITGSSSNCSNTVGIDL